MSFLGLQTPLISPLHHLPRISIQQESSHQFKNASKPSILPRHLLAPRKWELKRSNFQLIQLISQLRINRKLKVCLKEEELGRRHRYIIIYIVLCCLFYCQQNFLHRPNSVLDIRPLIGQLSPFHLRTHLPPSLATPSFLFLSYLSSISLWWRHHFNRRNVIRISSFAVCCCCLFVYCLLHTCAYKYRIRQIERTPRCSSLLLVAAPHTSTHDNFTRCPLFFPFYKHRRRRCHLHFVFYFFLCF